MMIKLNELVNMTSRVYPSDMTAVTIVIKKNKPANHLAGNEDVELFWLA